MRENTLSLGLKLLLITAIAGLLLGLTYDITKQPIADQAVLSAIAARKEVVPDATEFVELSKFNDSAANHKPLIVAGCTFDNVPQNIDNAFVGLKDGQIVGFTAQITVKGYSSNIEVVVGIDMDGKITGLNVGGSNFGETAGLGAKAKDEKFRSQFIGKTYEIILKKSNEPLTGANNVDAITAATKTSRAVTNGVNGLLEYMISQVESVSNGGANS